MIWVDHGLESMTLRLTEPMFTIRMENQLTFSNGLPLTPMKLMVTKLKTLHFYRKSCQS